jgi:hypothetical protein
MVQIRPDDFIAVQRDRAYVSFAVLTRQILFGEQMVRLVAMFLLFLSACPSYSRNIEQTSGEVQAEVPGSGPTASDFYRELLDPMPQPTSASFNDYYPEGSYHVSKLGLWSDFPRFVADEGQEFRALIILGPVGPLWSYYVFAFLRGTNDQVKVNEVVFPHARLTYKATGVISEARTQELLANLVTMESVEPVASPEDLAKLLAELDEQAGAGMSLGDFLFDLLIVDGHAGSGAYIGGTYHGSPLEGYPGQLTDELNSLADQLQATYEHGDPIPK